MTLCIQNSAEFNSLGQSQKSTIKKQSVIKFELLRIAHGFNLSQ